MRTKCATTKISRGFFSLQLTQAAVQTYHNVMQLQIFHSITMTAVENVKRVGLGRIIDRVMIPRLGTCSFATMA